MKAWRVAAVLAVMISVSWTPPASGQRVGLYDDFSSGVIDPLRWTGYENTVGPPIQDPLRFGYPDRGGGEFGPINDASVRRIVAGQAQIALATARGPGGKARNGLRINHPRLDDLDPPLKVLRATVTVAAVSVPDAIPGICAPTVAGRAGAELFGHFANDGETGFDPDELRGDIFASLALVRRVERLSSGGVVVRNVVEITLGRCTNFDCSLINFYGDPHVLSREWVTGVPYVLTIAWDPWPGTSAFTFTVVGGGGTESHTVDYITDLSGGPRAYAYDLRVQTQPVACRDRTTPSMDWVGGRVSIDARFDNVHLNIRAADTAR